MKKRHCILQVFLGGMALLILLPIAMTIFYSFFSLDEIQSFMNTRNQYGTKLMELKLSPHRVSLGQYGHILVEDISILRYYANSLLYAFVTLLGQAAVIPGMAYGLSRFEFPGKDAISFAVIVLLLLPFQVTMVPNVLMLRNLGLIDTLWAVVLPMIPAPFYIFLLRQFMLSLPNELFEAAQIDGAGPIRCFFHIALPASRPMLGAAAALSFADCWNMVEQPLAYLPKHTELYPLSLIFNRLTENSTGVEFAGAALYLLPALFVYFFFQEDILTGIQLTELK